jgi:transcriptional regulator with XRE-family HTH domain
MTEQQTAPVIPEFEMPDRLRRALRHADMGSNEMAEYLEVSRHTISNWINGHTRPPATAVKLWAMRCGVDYRWLSQGVENGFISVQTHIPAGIPAQPATPGHAPVENEITRLRKRIPLNPALALVLRMAA